MKILTILLFIFIMSNTIIAQKFIPIDNVSNIKFIIKNFGLSVDGSFSGLTGFLQFEKDNIAKSEIFLSVNSNSVNTQNKERDKHLKKEDYFNVDTFPLITFKSTKITKVIGLNKYVIVGNLTIKGITKQIEFDATISNKDSIKILKGAFQINRRTFKVGASSLVLSDAVKLNFNINCKEEQL